MILRTIATIILWGLLGGIVYGLKEPGAMWILNLCATLTLFEVYTILGRIGYPHKKELAKICCYRS